MSSYNALSIINLPLIGRVGITSSWIPYGNTKERVPITARDTGAAAQMAKVEEQELNNNPTALLQQGIDLYEGLD